MGLVEYDYVGDFGEVGFGHVGLVVVACVQDSLWWGGRGQVLETVYL